MRQCFNNLIISTVVPFLTRSFFSDIRWVITQLKKKKKNNTIVVNGLCHFCLSLSLSVPFQSAVYSTVNKTNCDDAVNEEDKEHDYSSIAEIKGLVPASSSGDLYATVRDIYSQPDEPGPADSTDPGYETIRIPKTNSSEDEHRAEGSDVGKAEPDYESVGELGLGPEMSRL